MKKIFFSAIAASLIFSGWQASANTLPPAPEISYGASGKAKAETTAKKTAKDKKEKADKQEKKEKADKDKKAKKDKKSKKGDAEKPSGAVAEYLKGVTFFNAEPNLGAEYFIYLQSASWCGPCNMEMPHIVDEYKIMKEDGRVEIILIGHDKTEEKAQGFLTQYGAEFPGVLGSDEKVPGLPGFAKASGIPNAIIVDADGNVVYKGHPGPLFSRKEWKIRTIEKDNH